ncbi:MAG: zinc metallopeptidase [Chloroflexi bacterium]|nr:zinc metallopeptidase [Chloroflexota bacterium]MBU1748235.1 zinc metallopeptidase [Chloroflexota bacterium]MBU1877343.1 zinc metallopeptidase [Chloroflexota bacterium]
MPYFYFDPLYLVFVVPAMLLVLFAQWRVNSAYNRYLKVPNSRGVPGVQAARTLLDASGLYNVQIEGTKGKLSDHYDPGKKVLRLSRDVANSASVAALGIVAHEVGHAQQDKAGDFMLNLRSAMVPAANIGSTLGYTLFFVGLLIQGMAGATSGMGTIGNLVTWGGIGLFAIAVIFTLVTLPVEFGASRRAVQTLESTGLVNQSELGGVRSVLNAAALTYVAALAQALSQLLYLIMLASGNRRRD